MSTASLRFKTGKAFLLLGRDLSKPKARKRGRRASSSSGAGKQRIRRTARRSVQRWSLKDAEGTSRKQNEPVTTATSAPAQNQVAQLKPAIASAPHVESADLGPKTI